MNQEYKKINLQTSDSYQIELSQSFFIPNQTKEIFQKRGLYTLSSRDIQINAQLERPQTNPFTDPSVLPIHRGDDPTIPTPLHAALFTGLIAAHAIESVDHNVGLHLNSVNYSVTTENSLSLTLNVSYLEDTN